MFSYQATSSQTTQTRSSFGHLETSFFSLVNTANNTPMPSKTSATTTKKIIFLWDTEIREQKNKETS